MRPRPRAHWRGRQVELQGGVSLAAFEAGSRRPDAATVVLVHGLGHWTQAAWDFVGAALEPTHRIVAFDLPGFGASAKPDRAYPLHFFASALQAVVADFSLERFTLVGHSLGGLIAALYASAQPARVGLLALVDPAGFLRSPKLLARILGSDLLAGVLPHVRPSRRFVHKTFENAVYEPSSVEPWMHAQMWELARDAAMIRAFVRVYRDARPDFLDLPRLHASLARYRGPALIVWGKHDRYVPIRALEKARRVYPQAAVTVFERCGHCPNLEFPEALSARLIAAGA